MIKTLSKQVPVWNRRILELKSTSDLTDKDWCEKIGVVQTNMKGYQEGTRSFTIEQLIRAAKMYNTTLDYLCGLTDNKPKPQQKMGALEMIEEGLRVLKTHKSNRTLNL